MPGNPNPSPSTRFSAVRRPKRTQFLSQSVEIASTLAKRIAEKKVDGADLASLVRSWVALMDCIRELRGIPRAGQLRPDLDPVQAARMLKRMRARQPLEIGNAGAVILDDADQKPAPTPTAARMTKAKRGKETETPPALDLDPAPGDSETPDANQAPTDGPTAEDGPRDQEPRDAGAASLKESL